MCAGEDMLLREREGGHDYVKVANDMESEKVLQVAWSHSGSKEWKNGFPPERTLKKWDSIFPHEIFLYP